MIDHTTAIISSTIEAFKEGQEEAMRQKKARQLDYQSKLVEKFNYSPQEFYVLLAKCLEDRKVPGLAAGLVKMYESVVGSSKRLYMAVIRERFVYYVCAAPFGSGFFFSWRLVDERRPAEWYHSVAAIICVVGVTALTSFFSLYPVIRALTALGLDSISISQFVPFLPLLSFLLLVASIWSIMRCASLPGYERLATIVEKVPAFGRVFERYFRPDTYYRQDSQKMYQKVFDYAINETITAVTTPQGIRVRDREGSPAILNLQDK